MTSPNQTKRKVVVVPCSGIGKPYGTVSREAAYILTEEMRPDRAELVPLSLLVLGDPEARAAVASTVAVTIDGCKLACSAKMVRESGGTIQKEIAVLDVFREHRDYKPAGIAELNPAGEKLARVIAEDAARELDRNEDPDQAGPVPNKGAKLGA